MGKPVKVEIPEGMHRSIKELISRGLYRSFSDFFYVAGQKELDRAIERLGALRKKNEVTA